MDLAEESKPLRPLPGMGAMQEACMALAATKCICRKPKQQRRAFCLGCYLRLPPGMQKALWRKVGHGFEQAYAAAKERLLG
jgi:hypothetical protein